MNYSTKDTAHGSARVAGETGLDEFALSCWRRKYLLLSSTAIFTAAAFLMSWYVPQWYEVQVLLEPVTTRPGSTGSSALGSALSQLGGATSLMGISLGGIGGASQEAIATLQSEVLTEQYIRSHDLLPILYPKLWDSDRHVWKVSDPSRVPTPWKANLYFAKTIRNVEVSSKTGLVTLSIKWKDPKLAADWANGLVALSNDYMRQKAITEADRDIAYLNEEVAKTSVVELRSAIYALMENEIKNSMLARGNTEYGLKVIDPAVTPERATYPKRVLWMLAGGALGLIAALLRVLWEFSMSGRRRN